MRLYEHEAKQVLRDVGLPTPESLGVVRSIEELDPKSLSYPVMVKAQALVGGRGKAGGIKRVASADDVEETLRAVFGISIKGYPVDSVLLEAAVEFSSACYLGVTVNPATGNNVIMASAKGGVDIEEVAKTEPQNILRLELDDNPSSLPEATGRELGAFLAKGIAGDDVDPQALADAASKLYEAYVDNDCKVAEINPLLLTPQGPVAADAKMVLDDNALYRSGRLLGTLGVVSKRHDVAEPTARERRAREIGFPYVDLLPENATRKPGSIYVGLVPGGAGYGIFSIDEVSNVGDTHFDGRVVPFNFMDSGGGPSLQAVADMFSLLMDTPLVDLIITSRFGGISSCDVFIRGLVMCLRQRHRDGKPVIPVYGRMVGTDLAAARAFLEVAGRETPEELEPLSMVVGNRKIMADVIREALEDFTAKQVAS